MTATKLSNRPSDFVEYIDDRLAAYQFDKAVMTFGMLIENALQERVKVGAGDNYEYAAKYRLDDLLTPGFTLPKPLSKKDRERAAVMNLQNLAGVKVWRAIPKAS